MRQKPSMTLPLIEPVKSTKYARQVRKYRLITPLFGGGVEKATADPVSTVRATEVRGQLRFWWRACRAAQYETLQDVKNAEDALWGAASTEKRKLPSEVQVAINVTRKGTPFVVEHDGQPITIGNPHSPYSYVAFPLQDKPDAVTVQGVEFELEINYPVDQERVKEVAAALWAWETFGGLGGRTRRGFGTLSFEGITEGDHSFAPAWQTFPENTLRAIKQGLQEHVTEGHQHPGLPMLWPAPGNRLKVIQLANGEPMAVWRELISKYQAFRQHREKGHFGRSLWPEADAIRRRTNPTRDRDELSQVDKFPRAQFGLPIIFHFEDADDPPDTTLRGVNEERLASPLILKPVACKGRQAVGMAVFLKTRLSVPSGLWLQGAVRNEHPGVVLTPAEAQTVSKLNGRTDVLQAFLDDLSTL